MSAHFLGMTPGAPRLGKTHSGARAGITRAGQSFLTKQRSVLPMPRFPRVDRLHGMRTAAARPRTGCVGANNSLVREEDPMLHPRISALSLARSLPAALLVLLLVLGAAPRFATAQEPVTLLVWDS